MGCNFCKSKSESIWFTHIEKNGNEYDIRCACDERVDGEYIDGGYVFDIKYCPYCGAELSKIYKEEDGNKN